MKTATEKFNERVSELGLVTKDFFNGRVAVTCEDGIHLLERQPSVPGFIPYEKVFPTMTKLRPNKDFLYACVNHFAADHEDVFLAELCRWFAGEQDKCPIYDFDLFYIPGSFHFRTTFFKDDDKMSREELMAEITRKVSQGYVLDASKMTCDKIRYTDGECDTINQGYIPCLITNDTNRVAVEYFEEENPIPLKEQVGLQGSCDYTLDYIDTPSLLHIMNAMVKP